MRSSREGLALETRSQRASGAWACLATALVIAGCGGQSSQARTRYHDPHPLPADTLTLPAAEIGDYGGRFVIAATFPPKTFNAMMANETSSNDVTDRMFGALAGYDNATQQSYPQLARSWDVSPDGLTYTWHLRRGARFSDGHPITAEDVLFSFRLAHDDTLHPAVQDLLKVEGQPFELSAPDSYTVIMRTLRPYAILVAAVGALRIMPRHRLEEAHRSGQYASAYGVGTAPESIVTSGAWRLKQFVAGEKTVLERNPYWVGVDAKGHRLPYLDELVYLIVPDQNTASLKLEAGDVDAVDNVRPEDYKTYADGAKAGHYTLYDIGPALNTNFIWFNLNTVREPKPGKRLGDPQVDPIKYAWFRNPVFRRAVSMAIDRDAIIRGPMYGEAVKNWSQATPGNRVWYTPDVERADYDPEQAKALLAGLGWKDSNGDGVLEDTHGNTVSFSIKTNGDNAIRVAMVNFIRDDLAKVGIRCILSPVDFNTLITNFRTDFRYEAALLGLQSGVPPDPGMGQNVWRSSGLTHYWNIKQPRPETVAEAEIDRLVDSLIATPDIAQRRAHWTAIQNLINRECFVIWLPTIKVKLPVRDRFGNLAPSVIPQRILWNIDRVFVKPRRARA
jgi:peptide/nickel transport system substrate-binding protein